MPASARGRPHAAGHEPSGVRAEAGMSTAAAAAAAAAPAPTTVPPLPAAPAAATAAAEPPPALSIVVPTFNNLPVLRQCVESWQRHAAGLPVELIVIEDGCRDDTPVYLDD